MNIGELISARRKQEGLTIDELVERSGVPKGTLNKITNGVTKSPSVESIKAIAKALNCTLDELNESEPQSQDAAADAELIRKYHAIDHRGKGIVTAILEMEYSRSLSEKRQDDEKGIQALSVFPNTMDA